MATFTKILKALAFLAVAAGTAFYFYAQNATRQGNATDLSPSANLVSLSQATGVPLPKEFQRQCGYIDSGIENSFIKALYAIDFVDAVDDARRAEAAALAYASGADQKMATVATNDAVSRWNNAYRIRTEIRCLEVQIQRQNY